jgi:hypothetical protein
MKSFIFSLLIFCYSYNSQAQVLKASVKVDFGYLPVEEVQNLDELGANIEDYINNYAWTDDEYETDIDISIYIMIETSFVKSHEKMYRAQFQIKSMSGESFYDKEWEFPYQPGYLMDHSNTTFDPLTDFIDYYCNLVLGGELDGYGVNLGLSYYDEAQHIANLASLSKYPKGWSNRLNDLQKIVDVRVRPLREAKPDFFEATYLLEEGKTQEAKIFATKVLDAIEKVVSEQPNNKYLKNFFDAHHVEFGKIFQNDTEALNRLIRYDNYHRETYRKAID